MSNKLEQWGRLIQRRKRLSTYMASFTLASIWTIAWMIVFFLSTLLANVETPKSAFVMILVLSVTAEAVIRFSENLDRIAFFAKPHHGKSAKGDNKDFKFHHMSILVLIGFFLLFAYGYLSSSDMQLIHFTPPLAFSGMGEAKGVDGIDFMVNNWVQCMQDPTLLFAVAISFVLRMFIYKRDHSREPLQHSS